jgi:DNA-binding NarL/FixJ family response regulator
MSLKKIRLLLIIREELILLGLKSVLNNSDEIEIVGEAAQLQKGLQSADSLNPDVILISLRFEAECILDVLDDLVSPLNNFKIVLVTAAAGDAEARKALDKGAKGIICLDTKEDEIIKAIKFAATGRVYIPQTLGKVLDETQGTETLTSAEHSILKLLVAGSSNKEIAAYLGISENTVKTHLANIFSKLGVTDRTSAAITALQRGFIRLDLS